MGRQPYHHPPSPSTFNAVARASALVPRRIHRHATNQRARL
ncbi:hypothetical protein ACW9IK_28275 [Pseudomonas gingeri]|nr:MULTISPECIES: hypothetical protein [Pseudomonas]BBP79835.1 hypothetical protein PHLH7_59390 [Pseudomonas sp. Ost2]